MLVSLTAMLCCCFLCSLLGFAASILFARIFLRTKAAQQPIDDAPLQEPPTQEKDLNFVANALSELTALVDLRVGQHSLRINEITTSLENPGEIGSAVILVAGQMLIGANRKLQSELAEAKQEIQRQREMMTSCMQESRMDALTGIPNRRALDEKLCLCVSDNRRFGSRFSILILDIDHFKRVNDRYGHMVGDQLLKSFARNLTAAFRQSDFIARFGGEEFVAILPKTTVDEACKIAERVRTLICAAQHKIGEFDLRVTASIGLKEFQAGETESELLEKADKALYAAKNGGRNCSYYHDGTKRHRLMSELADFPFELLPESFGSTAVEYASSSEMSAYENQADQILR